MKRKKERLEIKNGETSIYKTNNKKRSYDKKSFR